MRSDSRLYTMRGQDSTMAPVPFTRRQALETMATATGAAFVAKATLAADSTALHMGGKGVEVVLSLVTPSTVRIQVLAVDATDAQSVPSDGALVQEKWGKPVARLRGETKGKGVKCGDLTVAVSVNPVTIRVQDKTNRTVQEFRAEGDSGNVSFVLGEGPLLGLGQGGPQFDRRGKVDRMTSGQGGYQLRTHGAKVPIAFLVGTSGWAMYVHEPVVSFDLTGERGIFKPANS